MRKVFAALLLTLVASNASALDVKQLLATIAMPLAVAAVSNVTGVSQSQLASLVTTLNQANVPPTQFVEVIRYTPVALVDNNGQPFVTYVQDQTSQGVTGDALVNAIVQQLQSKYNVTPQLGLTAPATTLVVQTDYIPQPVLARFGTASSNPLALIALPLAVAAVADIAGVPQDQLANFVATLNNANVPPTQMIEVVRYVPVALIDEGQPFVQYVQTQASQGVTGPALVPLIVQRLRPHYPAAQINVYAPPPAAAIPVSPPPVVVVDQNYFPPAVVTRLDEVRRHPHGGPPGQIKKELGLQTGAEVVQREKHQRDEAQRPMIASNPAPAAPVIPPRAVAPQPQVPAMQGGDHGNRQDQGKQQKDQGNDKGHGNDKKHGKD